MKQEISRVALYARVSTEMQVEQFSISAQLNEMKEYAANKNWQVVVEYVDPGHSGRTLNRLGFQNLLKALDDPPWDIVMVHELSRLSRSIYDTFRLFDLFGNAKIGFYSVKDPNFDFSSAQGRFFLSVISATNQYYIDLLREHTAKGKRERARSGLYNSSTLAYGYEHHGDSRTPPRIHTKEADAVRLAFESYATSNCSFQQVADKLNDAGHRTRAGRLFSKDTIDDMLRNRFYLGKTVYGMRRTDHETEEFEGQHEPIITEELYNVCDQVRHLRRRKSRSYQAPFKTYLLNAVSHCSVCNQTLRAQATGSGRYYRDVSRMRGIANCPNSQKGVRANIVEAQIENIFRHLTVPDDWQEEVEQLLDRKDEIDVLNNRRARLRAEQVRLRQLFQGGYFGDDMETFKAESARLQREINALPVTDLASIEAAAETLDQLADVWDEADMETKRDMVRLVLNQVEIDVGQKRIVSLTPNAAFFPLFRQSDHLFEIETGRFVPVWPPALSENSPMPVLSTVQDVPSSENAISWPHIFNLPALPKNKRISPILSKFLKSRRQDILPVQKIIVFIQQR